MTKRGFTLVEILVYTSIVAIVFVIVLTGIINLWRASEVVRTSRDLNLSAATAMERMTREIRESNSVLTASSTLGTTPGVLVLNTDSASTTQNRTYKFSLTSGVLYLTTSSTTKQITSSSTNITDLKFWSISSTNTDAVRITMTIQSISATSTPTTTQTRIMHGSAVLRGSYLE